MANILDVAVHAGVSRTTVSRVINDNDRVDDETRNKVLKSMKELGYRPSRLAQSLRKQKTGMIAVLVSRVSNPVNSILLQGIEDEAAKHGYNVILCNTENDAHKELKYLKMSQDQQVDGIIMTGIRNDYELVQSFEQYGPIVMISQYTEHDIFPAVTVDNFAAAYTATKHLVKLGHRKIGMVSGKRQSMILRDREAGFRKALSDSNIPLIEEWVKETTGFTIMNGKRYVDELFLAEERPTAVFAANDELAVGVIQGVKERGLTVPRDMAVVGFDGQFICTVIEPHLTTMAQPIEQLGSLGMSLLVQKLRGEMIHTQRIVLKTELIIRNSCGAKGM
ncbi:LacI family DNA-binding transcriptional regulator [Paenibacillus filicis]|uniref:LacI family DNA-binding transcriptional regulator n=1 Tax=Paenibacillus gyeongsangnamensis TaxID=3388067 RepID=A0ABT4QJX2_9BACL|nr:LacI family DNA-binding transcriptional regulator [Paenibacillus filicis]